MASIKNPVTLNNSDGFSKQQTSIINSCIIAERNRWAQKSQQTTNKAQIGNGVDTTSGIVSGSKAYSFNNEVTLHFYLNAKGLSDRPISIITLYKDIEVFTITGNASRDLEYSDEGEVGNYVSFTSNGKEIYASLVDDLPSYFTVFECQLRARVNNG